MLSFLFWLLSCFVEHKFLNDKIFLLPHSYTFFLDVLHGFVVVIKFRWKMKPKYHFQRDKKLGKSYIHASQLRPICKFVINSILSLFLIFPTFWKILVFILSPFFNLVIH